MDKLLVTGGTGFIGYWLYQGKPKGFDTTWLSHKTFDQGGWDVCGYDYIIHLAPTPIEKVLRLAERCKAKLLFASSGCVHDKTPDTNAKMKKADERLIFACDTDWVIARIYTCCGAYLPWQRFAIGRFIEQAIDGRPLTVHNGGMSTRTYMYGSDLAKWLWRMLLDGSGVYEVGAAHRITIYDLAQMISRLIPPHAPLFDDEGEYPDAHPFYVPDLTRAKQDLGLNIEVSLREAIKLTVEDYKREKCMPDL